MNIATSRDQLLTQTLVEMQRAEPQGFDQSALPCNLIEHSADDTIGMWKIWNVPMGGLIGAGCAPKAEVAG